MEKNFGPLRFIPGANRGRYPYCHSLYIEADCKVIIDPASDRERLAQLRDDPGVDAVWLSHWHEDHFMSLDLFDDKELRISQPDAAPLQSMDSLFDAYGFNDEERAGWAPMMKDTFHFRPRRPSQTFVDGETIDLGGVTAHVILSPGHTPGHCSFLFPEQELLFIGDYDLTPFGPWYGDRDSDIDAVIESVGRLRSVHARTWIASHEQGVFESDPGELWDAFLKVIDTREERLLEALKSPSTIEDIVEACIVYGRKREPKEFYDFGERSIMGKHVERLIKNGRVAQDGPVIMRV